MSEYSVIHDVGSTLINMLWANFEADAQINPAIISSSAEITFDSPADMLPEHKLSVFLFRISENPFMRNREIEQVTSAQSSFPPCAVDLYYMITPKTQNRTNDHILSGKIIQILYDHAILRGLDLQGDLAEASEEFRVTFSPLSIETMTEVWNLFRDQSYMLSLCYQISPVRIDSTRTIEAERVKKKELNYYQIIGKKEQP